MTVINPCEGGYCQGRNEATEEPHTCPFDEEINDDHEAACTCCLDCQYECGQSI